MKSDQIKEVIEHVNALFPNSPLTDEIVRLIKKDFRQFDLEPTRAAVEQHRRTHEFVNYPLLLVELRVAHRSRSAEECAKLKNETWCDFQRRTNPELHDRSDYEVILRIHWRLWAQSGRREQYKSLVEGSCRRLLFSFGMNLEAATEWSQTVFGEEQYFRSVLEELRNQSAA
jgi:hypothetical protein